MDKPYMTICTNEPERDVSSHITIEESFEKLKRLSFILCDSPRVTGFWVTFNGKTEFSHNKKENIENLWNFFESGA